MSQTTKSQSGRASYIVSFGILLSRIFGLVREIIFAHYLGNSPAAGAFRIALKIPNFLQNLFGEGVLSASFIPVYTRLRASGDTEAAQRLAGTVGGLLALIVSFIVLIGVWATPALVEIVAPGFAGDLRLLTIDIVRILFPGVGLLVLSAWCLGILNSHRRFFISYVAPIFWNLVMIAVLLWYGRSATQNSLVIMLAWGSVVGSALQFGVQLPFVFQTAGFIKLSLDPRLAAVRTVFRNFVPVLISRGVVQLSAFIDGIIASFLGAAAVASLAYAQTLYLLPISLFGMAVAAAELPEMSESAGDMSEAARSRLRERLTNGLHRIAFFVIPSCVAFLILGREIVTLIFQSGKFGAEDSLYVWYILGALSIGLLASTWGRLYSSAFYALGNTKTPLHMALIRVFSSILLGVLFAFPFRPFLVQTIETIPGLRIPQIEGIELALGAIGLALGTALSGWLELGLLRRKLLKLIGPAQTKKDLILKTSGAAILAAGGAVLAGVILRAKAPALHPSLSALITLIVYGILYLFLAALWGVDELKSLVNRFTKRL